MHEMDYEQKRIHQPPASICVYNYVTLKPKMIYSKKKITPPPDRGRTHNKS